MLKGKKRGTHLKRKKNFLVPLGEKRGAVERGGKHPEKRPLMPSPVKSGQEGNIVNRERMAGKNEPASNQKSLGEGKKRLCQKRREVKAGGIRPRVSSTIHLHHGKGEGKNFRKK